MFSQEMSLLIEYILRNAGPRNASTREARKRSARPETKKRTENSSTASEDKERKSSGSGFSKSRDMEETNGYTTINIGMYLIIFQF